MGDTGTGLLGYLSKALKKVEDHKTTLINLLITLQVFGLERLSSLVVFKCPCFEKVDEEASLLYGLAFLIAPAVVLLLIGYLMDPLTIRLLTGLSKRKNSNKLARAKSFLSIFIGFSIAPVSWLSIALLDGKYYACATTPNPYLNSCAKVYQGKDTYSKDFELNRAHSQVIGWGLLAISVIVATAGFSWRRYTSAVSHWQKQYIDMTNRIEREQFEAVSQAKIEKDTKARILYFLKKAGTKKDWDDVTDLFHVSGENCLKKGFSSLQTWGKLNGFKLVDEANAATNTPAEPTNGECANACECENTGEATSMV